MVALERPGTFVYRIDCLIRNSHRHNRFCRETVFQGVVRPAVYRQPPHHRHGYFSLYCFTPKKPEREVAVKSALWIGVAQGIAVAPGISRSGATIGTALLLGIKPRDAAEFSFLIGIPAMTIAAVLTYLEEPAAGTESGPLLVAIIAAFIAGYASIGLCMKWLQENKFYYFAYYCVIAGSIFAVLTYPGY